jgi:hypothetical protein
MLALTVGQKMVEWNHFSGFLAAAAGVSMGQEMVKGKGPIALARRVVYLPQSPLVEQTTRKEKTETTIKVTDTFIAALLKLIVSDHDVIRETTTELAGSTLSPAVYCTTSPSLEARAVNLTHTSSCALPSPASEGEQIFW